MRDKYSYHKYNELSGIICAIGLILGITLIVIGLR